MRILFLQHFRLILDRFVIIIVSDEEVFSRFITNVYVEYSFSSSLNRIELASSRARGNGKEGRWKGKMLKRV